MFGKIAPALILVLMVPGFAFAQTPVPTPDAPCKPGTQIAVQGAGGQSTTQQNDKTTIDSVSIGGDGKVKVVSLCGTPGVPGTVTMCFLNGLCVKCSKAQTACNAASAQSQAAAGAISDPVASGKALAQSLAQDTIKNPTAWQKVSGGMESILSSAYGGATFMIPSDQMQMAKSLDSINTEALRAIASGNFDALPAVAERAKSIMDNPEVAKIFSDPAQTVRMLPASLQAKATDIINGFKGVAAYSSQASVPVENTFGSPSSDVTSVETREPVVPERTPGIPVQARTTFYAPGAGGNIEGKYETSRPNLEGEKNSAGNPIPRTLDDVRLGKANYVTLASDPSNYGKTYNLGTVTYTSALDNQTYELQNVTGYVHDTGSAFKGRPDKFDIAVGNFNGWSASAGSQFVDKQPYGANVVHTWEQIGKATPGGTTAPSTGFAGIVSGILGGNSSGGIFGSSGFEGMIQNVLGGGNASSNSGGIGGMLGQLLGGSNPLSSLLSMGSNGIGSMLSGLTKLFTGGGSNSAGGTAAGSGTGASQSGSAPTPVIQGTPPTPGVTPPTPTSPSVATPVSPVTPVTPVISLIAQSKTASAGSIVLFLWSTAGVRTDKPCELSSNSVVLAQTNEGSENIQVQSTVGTQVFTLTCTPSVVSAAQPSISRSVSVTIVP